MLNLLNRARCILIPFELDQQRRHSGTFLWKIDQIRVSALLKLNKVILITELGQLYHRPQSLVIVIKQR